MRLLANARQAGFTLLETMIAMAIMMVAFASILMVESASINSSMKAKQMNVVAMLAKNLMVETEYMIEGKTFSEVKKEETGQFKEPYQDYSWKREVKEIEFPPLNLSAAAGNAASGEKKEGSGDQNADTTTETLGKLFSNFLSKALREVTVTISWKKGTGSQSFSLSTYWVDLNHEFSITQ